MPTIRGRRKVSTSGRRTLLWGVAKSTRAYYQLGCCYYYQFKNYQTAGYYFKKCIELDAAFPDVYEHHLKLLTTLKMHKCVHEENQNFDLARAQYKLAAMATSCQADHTLYEEHLTRITNKLTAKNRVRYTYQGN